MAPRVILLWLSCALIPGCDSFGLGYVNKLHHSVTIVEHGYAVAQPFTLKPGEVKQVGFGHVASTFDVQGGDSQPAAHYRTHDIPRTGSRRGSEFVVIDASGVHIERKESFRYDE